MGRKATEPAHLVITIYHTDSLIGFTKGDSGELSFDGDTAEYSEAYRYVPHVDAELMEYIYASDEKTALEKIYEWDNMGNRPLGVRSLSAGDIVTFQYPREDRRSSWICEWLGWKAIDLN